MPNLFPVDYETEQPVGSYEKDNEPVGYKPGIDFNYNTGDFARDGKMKVKESSGIDSWKSWIVNCLSTQRYKHLAYSTDFGIELDAIFNAGSQSAAESVLTRQITEALMADPYGRTEFVQFNLIDWRVPGAVFVDMTVMGINDVTIDIQTYITRGN